jgi:hypothetical protein
MAFTVLSRSLDGGHDRPRGELRVDARQAARGLQQRKPSAAARPPHAGLMSINP